MFRKSQSTLLAACAAAGLLSASPAFAINDDGRGGMYESLLDMVGMGEKSDPPPIAYRERSPLVVPPKMELPAPKPAPSQRAAAWPTDQEVVRARKKADTSGKRKYLESEGGEKVSIEDLRAGRPLPNPAEAGVAPAEDCSMDVFSSSVCPPHIYWARLAGTPTKKEEQGLQAGVEPPREYLTQPPKGYLKATQNVKATFEPKVTQQDDAQAYYREQARKRDE